MTSSASGGAPESKQVSPRLKLHLQPGWQASARVAPPPVVLGGDDEPSGGAPLSLFAPAEPPVEVVMQPPPQVLGAEEPAQAAVLEYQPSEPAVYALLQEIHTPDGVVYDFTLPQRPAAQTPQVLGAEDESGAGALLFPVNQLVGGAPAAGTGPQVLGVEDTIGGAAASLISKRVLQVIRSPLDSALLAAVRQFEGPPRVLALRNGTWSPLEGFEAWRALLPPGGERRVLLYVHGFGSNTLQSGGSRFVPLLADRYDAILGYDHPTVGRTPLENALALLEMVPDDVQLAVDLMAHSRGGLVVRSLVELVPWQAKLRPARLLTAGTPHAGTRLAEPERWDRLVSIGMTMGSWLAAAGGAPFWVPKLLEFVLKAAAQGIFDLPGVGAMTPGSDFLQQLNAPDTPGLDDRVRYGAVTSTFEASGVSLEGFRQALAAMAIQVFMGVPNDMVVPTASAIEIDSLSRKLTTDQQFKTSVDHGGYFDDEQVRDFLKSHLLSS